MSCASAGNCVAGGYYTYGDGGDQSAFVAVERNGRWGTAIQLPGLKILNTGSNSVDVANNDFSVSCAPTGPCAAGWYYASASGDDQGLVTQPG